MHVYYTLLEYLITLDWEVTDNQQEPNKHEHKPRDDEIVGKRAVGAQTALQEQNPDQVTFLTRKQPIYTTLIHGNQDLVHEKGT